MHPIRYGVSRAVTHTILQHRSVIRSFAAADRDAANFNAVAWRLLDPYGAVVFGPGWMINGDIGPVTLSNAGTYTLLIEGRFNQTGTINYSWLDARAAGHAIQTLEHRTRRSLASLARLLQPGQNPSRHRRQNPHRPNQQRSRSVQLAPADKMAG